METVKNMIQKLLPKEENCCGCGACEAICPKEAIEMKLSARGFYYPRINEKICIGCEACVRVCSFSK